MKQIFLASFSFIFFIACSNDEKAAAKPATWDEPNKAEFMEQCISGAIQQFSNDSTKANSYCNCMLQKIEARYPIADSAGTMSYNEMTVLAKDCLN